MFVAESFGAIYLCTKEVKMKHGLHAVWRETATFLQIVIIEHTLAHSIHMVINSSIILILIDEETEAVGFINLPEVTKMVSAEAGRNLDVRQPW